MCFKLHLFLQKTSELFISYRGGDFLHTEFDSNLDKKSFHVTDTSDSRLMIAVSHTETLSNLYVSDVEANQEKYLFRLSLERLFCFFPNVMWVDSWLTWVFNSALFWYLGSIKQSETFLLKKTAKEERSNYRLYNVLLFGRMLSQPYFIVLHCNAESADSPIMHPHPRIIWF